MGIEEQIPLASELRAKLENAQSIAAETQIMELVTKITRALENGGTSVQVMDFQPGVEAMMRKRGYKVTHYSPDQRDPRERAYYTISW